MVRKRRKKRLESANEARRLARQQAGQPPSARIIPDKRRKLPKHKKEIIDEEWQ
ncbi:MAG: hypothetical protein ACRD5W_16165 [Candidatus Acidiferrales bacterium]